MPGNSELEFVRDLPNIAENVPVILVTGYPLVNSAIESVKLRVEAYLIKPLDFQELLGHVHIAVEHFQVYCSVRNIKQRLQYWHDGLGDIEELLRRRPPQRILAVPGMPLGSPGMEHPKGSVPYESLLVAEDGSVTVFERHGPHALGVKSSLSTTPTGRP